MAQAVVNSTGGIINSGLGLYIEYSVGEVATATVGDPSGNNTCYTAGVIQPDYKVALGTEDPFDKHYFLKVFPNPVAHQLNIETDFKAFDRFRFFDADGRLVQSGQYEYLPLDLSWMAAGAYVLTLSSEQYPISKTIKIVKQ
jgi:hypothetical protein